MAVCDHSKILRIFSGLLAALFLVACSSKTEGFDSSGKPEFSDEAYQRVPPEVILPEFSGAVMEQRDDGMRNGSIDLTNIAKGYIGIQCNSATKAVLRMQNGASAYNYDLASDGQTQFLPLAMGNGNYNFTLLFQLEGSEYEEFINTQVGVQLEDEKAPFVIPNLLVDYDASSQVVQYSYELAQHASNDVELVQQVYYWVENNIVYDTEKARALQTANEYTPEPDKILSSKQGICYDYAAVVAAMLRANAIPCKLVMGNVSGENGEAIYHAWNMIWLEEQGWVTIEIPTTPNQWQRLDLTFAAASDTGVKEFIGDGNNYMETSVH